MPQVMTEKSLVVLPKAPECNVNVAPPGFVIVTVDAEGVAHHVRFDPDEAESWALGVLRQSAQARALRMAAAQAPTLPRLVTVPPSSGPNGGG